MMIYRAQETLPIEGFCYVVVEAAFQSFHPFMTHPEGSLRNNGHIPIEYTNGFGCRNAVHNGQLQVH